jgi:hypothetical protein
MADPLRLVDTYSLGAGLPGLHRYMEPKAIGIPA